MELSNLQKQIVETEAEKVVVISAAASGKTQVLTERARFLIKKGIDPNKICVITFTNLAAHELKTRLANDYKQGMYIGTIHGLANQMLLSKGINTESLINNDKFDELFEKVEENPGCVKHYDYLLLDEAQDSSNREFNFIFNMIDPFSFFIVGDGRQSIYSFRGSNPKLLERLSSRTDVTTFSMNENYRNSREILQVAKSIIRKNGIEDDSVPIKSNMGEYMNLDFSPEILSGLIRRTGEFKDWTVLVRTNSQVDFIRTLLEQRGIPTITFKQGDLSKEELEEFLVTDKVRVITIHASKGLTLKRVVVYGAWWKKAEEIRLNYVAATRAEEGLYWFKSTKPKKTYKREGWF